MRYYIWYCIELDMIMIQNLGDNCEITFEWCFEDFHKLYAMGLINAFDSLLEFDGCSFIPLGEL